MRAFPCSACSTITPTSRPSWPSMGSRVDAQVIGVALDGTGYGEDGTIWGGEILLAGYAGFERLGHLRAVAMPGGEAAVRQPWRMALSWLRAAGIPWEDDLACVQAAGEQGLAAAAAMLDERSPLAALQPRTSSMGRLFDAAASLAGLRQQVNYEAQAAIELEALIDSTEPGSYTLDLDGNGVLDPAPALRQLVADCRAGVPPGVMAARFHRGVAQAVVEVCLRARLRSSANCHHRPERRGVAECSLAADGRSGAADARIRGAAAPQGAGQRWRCGAGTGGCGWGAAGSRLNPAGR